MMSLCLALQAVMRQQKISHFKDWHEFSRAGMATCAGLVGYVTWQRT